ncbi:protein CNPPD1 [Ciona intestinalis]
MHWSNEMEQFLSKSDFSEGDEIERNIFDHHELSDRLRKTFYYSPQKNPSKDTLSFSITKETVETFRKAAPTSFEKLGHRYAARVARDACVSPCSMLLAMIYIDRLTHRDPEYLQNISSSDLFLVSMMVASKYMYDEGIEDEVFNDEWAASGLVDTDHVNELEAEFLHAMDWRVLVGKPEFQTMVHMVEARLALEHGLDRGWFSYTDTACLIKSNTIIENIKRTIELFSQAVCLCMVLYGSFVMLTVASVAMLKAKPMKSITPMLQDQHVSLGFTANDNISTDTANTEPIPALEEIETPMAMLNPTPTPTPTITNGGVAHMLAFVETMLFISTPTCFNDTSDNPPYVCPRCQQHKPTNQTNQLYHPTPYVGKPNNNHGVTTSFDSLLQHSFTHKHNPPIHLAVEPQSLYSPHLFDRPIDDAIHYHCTYSLPGVIVIT